MLQPMANQTWQFREFPAPNGEQAAVTFLNEPARQGRGEATATLRNNGTAGLVLADTLSAHKSAGFGVHVPAGLGGDVLRLGRAGGG